MEEEKIYPPRFTVQACGSSATGHSVARIEFKGSCEELVMEIVLSGMHWIVNLCVCVFVGGGGGGGGGAVDY